jgi:hypothetical protein
METETLLYYDSIISPLIISAMMDSDRLEPETYLGKTMYSPKMLLAQPQGNIMFHYFKAISHNIPMKNMISLILLQMEK